MAVTGHSGMSVSVGGMMIPQYPNPTLTLATPQTDPQALLSQVTAIVKENESMKAKQEEREAKLAALNDSHTQLMHKNQKFVLLPNIECSSFNGVLDAYFYLNFLTRNITSNIIWEEKELCLLPIPPVYLGLIFFISVTIHRLLEEKTSMLEAQGAAAGARSEVTELREERAKLAGQVSLASHQLDTLRVSYV